MDSQRRGLRGLLPTIALATTLFAGSCTEPEAETARPIIEDSVHVDTDELTVTGPYSHENLEVFLIHSSAQRKSPRKIMTLEEAMAQNKVKVHETGDVQELTIENLTEDTDIWVQSGDIVQGGKQDRVLTKDILVPPNSGRLPLASFCVEQGRWSIRAVQFGSLTAAETEPALQMIAFESSQNSLSSKELKKAARLTNAQSEVWSAVQFSQARLAFSIGQSVVDASYASSLEMTLGNKSVKDATAKYQEALGSVTAGKKNVVGFAFAINGELNSAEIYSSGDLFHKLWDKMLQAAAVEAVSIANEKQGPKKPTTVAAVKTFLAVKKDTKALGLQVNARMRCLTVDGSSVVFSETRDREANSAWVHRSYFAK